MCLPLGIYAQVSPRDTIFTLDDSFESIVRTKARDSIHNDFIHEQLHLFGEAELEAEGISLKAAYLLVDFKKNEVMASYSLDADSNRIGLPVFSDGSEEIKAARIRYNFDSKKGYILEMLVKQDENFLYMDVAKRQANDEVHFKRGRFTHCDLEEPHYHFQLSRAVLIPDKRIVSGPMNLWIKGVPTPIGLPFMFIPQQQEKDYNHGILFPQFSLQSPWGMGFQNLGYYIPINDRIQTSIYTNLYARGSWGLSNQTDYKVRYKYDGSIQAGYQVFTKGFPNNDRVGKISLRWNHRQDPKANPFWNFSSAVNFNSDNQTKTSLDVLNNDYFKSTVTSDININRLFPGKPYAAGMKISARQNSVSKSMALVAPQLTFNVTRFSPLAKLRRSVGGSKKWYEQIMMTYNLESQNKNTFADSILTQQRFDLLNQTRLNGVSQNTTLQGTIGLFKNTWKLNPSLTYNNKINFQQIRKSYDANLNQVLVDTLRQTGMAHNLSFNMQVTTVLYSYYRVIGKSKPLLRHVLTPSFGWRYAPNLLTPLEYESPTSSTPVRYSAFERSLYAESAIRNSSVLTFGFNNTLELKYKSSKDSIATYKKLRLIDGLSFSGSYDFMKDSMRLSNISANLRINPLPFVNIVSNATLSPYDWNDSTNTVVNGWALAERGKLARLQSVGFSTNLVLTTPESRKKLQKTQEYVNSNWNADYQYFALHPGQYIDFSIPWKLSFSHILELQRVNNPLFSSKAFNLVNTLQTTADVSLSKRWKVIWNAYADMERKQVVNMRFSLTRDMHCWNLAVDWTPVGLNKNFLLRINSTSNLFRDAKIELKKPPVLL